MPLYEYRCEDCGRDFEVRQKFSDAPISTCLHCGGNAKKRISQTAFALKGGGWYEQGYSQEKSSPSPAANSNDAGSSSPRAANG